MYIHTYAACTPITAAEDGATVALLVACYDFSIVGVCVMTGAVIYCSMKMYTLAKVTARG